MQRTARKIAFCRRKPQQPTSLVCVPWGQGAGPKNTLAHLTRSGTQGGRP